eukprot:TRINITY_DN2445_c0_g1_i1.p1 TRINITY_DN2445_c0_g1~~TRINITY_DN2445_c0_g1_i1.p1  ORF type:complete len:418 (-),score=48.56 TRINITY_DN2445_c0_g1_i1:61-1314(-)
MATPRSEHLCSMEKENNNPALGIAFATNSGSNSNSNSKESVGKSPREIKKINLKEIKESNTGQSKKTPRDVFQPKRKQSSLSKRKTYMEEATSPRTDPSTIVIDPNSSLSKTLAEILTCSICTTVMESPIYGCPAQNHPICSKCCPTKCPVCSTPCDIPLMTLPSLETLSELLPRLCRYSDNGCQACLPLPQLKKHTKECPFTPLTCLVCSWSSAYAPSHVYHSHNIHGWEIEEISGKKPWKIAFEESKPKIEPKLTRNISKGKGTETPSNRTSKVVEFAGGAPENDTTAFEGDHESIGRIIELKHSDLYQLQIQKRVSSFFFQVRALPRTGFAYDIDKFERSILVATDEWKGRKLSWHGFVSKASSNGQDVESPTPLNGTELSSTQLLRPKKVSDSSWEIVWRVKRLTIHGFVSAN